MTSLEDVHAVIDNTQYNNPNVEFEVTLVDECGMKVFRINDIYVDVEHAIMSITFDSRKQVVKP